MSPMAASHVSAAMPGHAVTRAPAGHLHTRQLGGHRPHWPRDWQASSKGCCLAPLSVGVVGT